MTIILQEIDSFRAILLQESRKRKYLFENEDLPPAKRQKLMAWVSQRFLQRCREYQERKRKIMLGLMLYLEAQTRDARRKARKRPSGELYAEYEGFLMAKYPKLVQETPTVAQLIDPVNSTSIAAEVDAAAAAVAVAITSAIEVKAKLEADVKDEVSTPPQKRRLIKRLPENVEEKEVTETKEVTVTRRKRWRRKGEKRS